MWSKRTGRCNKIFHFAKEKKEGYVIVYEVLVGYDSHVVV
jgi:hypothetical protein